MKGQAYHIGLVSAQAEFWKPLSSRERLTVMLEILAAWRGLQRQRSGVLLAILTLAVASCAAALVFTVVNAVLVRPLPIRDASRVAIIWEKRKSEAGKYGVSGADFYDWQQGAAGSVESMTAQDEHPLILAGPQPETVIDSFCRCRRTDFEETFGVSPLELVTADRVPCCRMAYGKGASAEILK